MSTLRQYLWFFPRVSILALLACLVDCGGGGSGDGSAHNIIGNEVVLYSFGGTGDGANPQGNVSQASDGALYGMTINGGDNSLGTVFKITTGGTEAVLHSFGGTGDGADPFYGSLVQASDGAFYGVTFFGGTNNKGTVFKITMTGVETVLHSFGGTGDGANPYGSLIQASDGNLYGMTNVGGTNSNGTVFKITMAGVETVLYSFGGTGDGAFPQGSLVQANDGNLYGMTVNGGANGAGMLFQMTTAGVETVLHSFGGTGDGATPYGSLIQASDGILYGMTNLGGADNKGTVFKITTGGTEAVLHSFGGTGDGATPNGSLIQASDGNLYGITTNGGDNYYYGTVFKITTSGTETVLHSFGGTGDGFFPFGSLIQASDGNLYGMTGEGGSSNLGTVFQIN